MGQNRTLTNLGLRANVSYAKGVHNIKIGATYMDTILTEKDSIGIVDPTANAPCLNPDGSPYTEPVADRSGGMHRDCSSRIPASFPCWAATT